MVDQNIILTGYNVELVYYVFLKCKKSIGEFFYLLKTLSQSSRDMPFFSNPILSYLHDILLIDDNKIKMAIKFVKICNENPVG